MTKQDDFLTFMDGLENAATKITEEYFTVKFSGTIEEKYRERVYCYELYHQLRANLPNEFLIRYKLHGEMDKRTHIKYSSNERLRFSIPDFIVHIPDTMEHNLAVIEVKHCKSLIENIEDDIIKLSEFVKVGKYNKGICYLFGVLCKEEEDRLKEKLDRDILLVFHRSQNNYETYCIT